MEFSDVVRSEEELRALMGDPVAPAVVDKTLSALDRHCRAFIARAPFVLVATSDGAGRMDISPKGDAPGFVRVLDDEDAGDPRPAGQPALRHLPQPVPVIARRADVPRSRQAGDLTHRRARRSGAGRGVARVADRALARSPPWPSRSTSTPSWPSLHCSKCMIRSHLWQHEQWAPLDGLPTLAETMKECRRDSRPRRSPRRRDQGRRRATPLLKVRRAVRGHSCVYSRVSI